LEVSTSANTGGMFSIITNCHFASDYVQIFSFIQADTRNNPPNPFGRETANFPRTKFESRGRMHYFMQIPLGETQILCCYQQGVQCQLTRWVKKQKKYCETQTFLCSFWDKENPFSKKQA
jgi:hypothetical protein